MELIAWAMSRNRKRAQAGTAALLVVLLLAWAAPRVQAQDATSPAKDPVERAMRDEMARSLDKLRLEGLERPYFIAYRITDRETQDFAASFGSLTRRLDNRMRYLSVELRVGDYQLDNTNFAGRGRGFGQATRLPLDDDYQEIRRQIWLATDQAYKSAVQQLSAKRAYLQNRNRTQQIPDFTREEPFTGSEIQPAEKLDAAAAETLVRGLSEVFRQMPQIWNSLAQLGASETDVRYLNSEGSWFHRVRPWISLSVIAYTQAGNGMPLDDFVAAYGHKLSDLPSQAELAARVRAMAVQLQDQRQAATVELYNGPVLVEGQAAAELFAQGFAPKLLAAHPPLSENQQLERAADTADAFADKLGARVLASILSVKDEPLLEQYQGQPLLGGYSVDDDGIKTHETVLVENGILKARLAARSPSRGITRSTGSRRGNGPAPSNLIVSASQSVTTAELRRQLLEMATLRGREYAIVIRRMGSPFFRAGAGSGGPGRDGTRLEGLIAAYKVFADGHEEPVRNLELGDFGVASFKDVVAVSDTAEVYTTPFFPRPVSGYSGLGGVALVSVAVPAMLFDDLTLKMPTGEFPKPPVAPPPFQGN